MTRPQLHGYQQEAIEFLHGRGRAALFLDMGLGKTATVLCALTPEHLPALVIAPKRVAEMTWDAEVRKWRPDLTISKAIGSPVKRKRAMLAGADITVIGRDNIGDIPDDKELRGRWRTVVIDELSGFKTTSSARSKLARKILKDPAIVYRWGLTGSPTPNGLMDLFGQIHLIDGGERLGRYIGGFRQRFFVAGQQLQNGVVTKWLMRDGADKVVLRLIEDIALAMETEGRVDLPPVTENVVSVALPPRVREVYRAIKDQGLAELDVLGVVTAPTAGHLSNRFAQITAGMVYADRDSPDAGAYEVLHLEKVRAAQEIVEGTGSPCLVFYRYRAEKEQLLKAFGEAAHTMEEPDILDRWNAGQVPVLLAHPASAGHGLNLQHGGHTVIWTSLPWSMEEWAQANKRLARQGQKHPVVIHVIQAEHTIDARMRDVVAGKLSFQDAVMEHLESPL